MFNSIKMFLLMNICFPILVCFFRLHLQDAIFTGRASFMETTFLSSAEFRVRFSM